MAATVASAVPPDVALFLQDVIGDALQDGKLRQYHARIVKEVEQSKIDLHATVQKEWPNLDKQLRNSLELTQRLQELQDDIARVEQELEGSDHSLRSRLTTALTAHRDVLGRHTTSAAQVELLASLSNAHRQLEQMQTSLDAGSLDEAVSAVLNVESYLINGFEPWKRESRHYTELKERCDHLKALVREELEAAYNACLSFDAEHGLTIRTVYAESGTKREVSLPSILASLAKLGASQHLQRTTKQIIDKLVSPIVVAREQLVVQRNSATAVELQLQASASQSESLEQLRSLSSVLDALSAAYRAKDGFSEQLRQSLLGDLFKAVQQLVITYLLEASIPLNASIDDLNTFEQSCKAVAAFEQVQLAQLRLTAIQPVLKQWTDAAPQHWSKNVIQKAYEQLRKDIVSPEYWNKTQIVQWEEEDAQAAPAAQSQVTQSDAVSQSAAATLHAPEPAMAASPALAQRSPPSKPAVMAASPPRSPQSTKRDSDGNLKHDISLSPPAEDDAWGFDDDDADDDEAPLDSSVPTTPPQSAVVSQGDRTSGPSETVGRNGPNGTGGASIANGSETAVDDKSMSSNGNADPASPVAADGWDFDDAADSPKSIKHATPQKTDAPALTSPAPVTADSLAAAAVDEEEEDAWASWDEPLAATSPIVSKAAEGIKRSISPAAPPKVGKLGAVRAADLAASKSQQSASETMPTSLDTLLQPAFEESTAIPALSSLPKIGPEPMMISQRCTLVLSAMQNLADAARATEQLSSYTSGTAVLHQASDNVLDLYRALMPVAHAQLLESVPSLGMQYVNDCTYISRESRASEGSRGESTSQLSPSRRLAQHATQQREEQIIMQEKNLLSELDELDHLESVDIPDRFVNAQRTMHQLLASIERLAKAWKPVLRPSQYADSMGQIVDSVLTRVLEDVEGQEDISEEASKRLCVLCGILHGVEPLFDVNGESQIALYVPIWFKYKFLSELMEASMADIMFLFNEGHLVDFEREELSNLVRALFADSPLREKNLAIIAGLARP